MARFDPGVPDFYQKLSNGRPGTFCTFADVAQLVEQLICNQQVGGSTPPVGPMFYIRILNRWNTYQTIKRIVYLEKKVAVLERRFSQCIENNGTAAVATGQPPEKPPVSPLNYTKTLNPVRLRGKQEISSIVKKGETS